MKHKRQRTTTIEHEIDVQYADLVAALRLIGAIPKDAHPVRVVLGGPICEGETQNIDLREHELLVQWTTTEHMSFPAEDVGGAS